MIKDRKYQVSYPEFIEESASDDLGNRNSNFSNEKKWSP